MYALYCKNAITGEWMLVGYQFFTKLGAQNFAKIYTDSGFEIDIREWSAE